ncbi:DedA family protein [Streptomyces sp. ST2-7A]|uniref:DedA family protein n=1 Tax=Streptomyces sp. ST2-7A TaxID=2907214 RepID=UPI001F28E00C|nr:DedA family protein [Streptomyces sp. ST2-7A]MCE7079413.1 DedA family protein [Streptomyces sp. ST2-7A]
MEINAWLATIPPLAVYTLVTVVILIEMLGVPLPGEIILVSAALLASQGVVDPLWVGVCATVGACVGDSLGYLIGRKGGRPLFARLGRRFPRHFSETNIAAAERAFHRWGAWAVFFGRFIALLRIFAGPLAGVLRMPYGKFLAADLPGGILWAGGTTAVIYYLGVIAQQWLHRFSWVGLLIAVLAGALSTWYIKRRAGRATARLMGAEPATDPAPTPGESADETTATTPEGGSTTRSAPVAVTD